jgi:hypothetical protein
VRLFVAKSGDSENSKGHRGRVFQVDEKNVANPKELKDAYKAGDAASNCMFNAAKNYTAIISAFNQGEPLGGKLIVESDLPMIVQQLADESQGYVKKVFSGEWSFHNSGGCSNHGTFDKNPAYCIQVKLPETYVFFRLMVTSEVSPDGSRQITDPMQLNYAVGAQMYRI